MYFTSLPDHSKPNFDERAHFSQFKKHNLFLIRWVVIVYAITMLAAFLLKQYSAEKNGMV